MAFNPNQFINDLSRNNGIAQQSTFMMMIDMPRSVMQNKEAKANLKRIGLNNPILPLSMRVDSTEFPGRSINNVPYRDYGVLRKMAFETNFVDITSTIILSSDFRERVFFEIWQDMISGNYRTQTIGGNNPATQAFSVGYYQDYVADVKIQQYDESGELTYTCTLVDAYPQLTASLSASWASSDIQKATVTWSYRYFKDEINPNHKSHVPVNQRTGNWFLTSGAAAGASVVGGVAVGKLLSPKNQQLAAGAAALGRLAFKQF